LRTDKKQKPNLSGCAEPCSSASKSRRVYIQTPSQRVTDFAHPKGLGRREFLPHLYRVMLKFQAKNGLQSEKINIASLNSTGYKPDSAQHRKVCLNIPILTTITQKVVQ
jgi:hypothetical protein